METVNTHVTGKTGGTAKSTHYLNRSFNRQIDFFEQNRFGMMAVYIIAQSCIGSIACMYVLQKDPGYFMLALCVVVTMGANSFFIAQSSAKLCIAMTYISIVVNLLLISFV